MEPPETTHSKNILAYIPSCATHLSTRLSLIYDAPESFTFLTVILFPPIFFLWNVEICEFSAFLDSFIFPVDAQFRVILAPQDVAIKNSFPFAPTGILKWKFNIPVTRELVLTFCHIVFFRDMYGKVEEKPTIILHCLYTSMIYSNIHYCENSHTSWTFTICDILVSL